MGPNTDRNRSPLEVIHTEQAELIINRGAAGDPARIQALVDVVKDGLPAGWPPLPGQRIGHANAFVNSLPDPRYVAKVRTPRDDSTIDGMLIRMHPHNPARREAERPALAEALGNPMVEMGLVPAITSLLATDKAVELAERHGLERIFYVEPLVASRDRQQGTVIQYYDYVHGESLEQFVRRIRSDKTLSKVEQKGLDRQVSDEAARLANDLRDLLSANGIVAYDLSSHQFIFGPDGKSVYLLDAEAYIRRP